MARDRECPECNNEWPHCKVCDRVCPTCSGYGEVPEDDYDRFLREADE